MTPGGIQSFRTSIFASGARRGPAVSRRPKANGARFARAPSPKGSRKRSSAYAPMPSSNEPAAIGKHRLSFT